MFPRCPRCKDRLRYETIRYKSSFPCTECHAMLHIPPIYTAVRSYLVLAICAFLLFRFGFRHYTLPVNALPAWFPALFLEAKFGRTFFPPMIRVEEDIGSRTTRIRLYLSTPSRVAQPLRAKLLGGSALSGFESVGPLVMLPFEWSTLFRYGHRPGEGSGAVLC